MKHAIKEYCDKRRLEFHSISEVRKSVLKKIAAYIKFKEQESINLLFVSDNNSRRSLFVQIWSNVAAQYYDFHNFNSFSCGLELSEFNPNAVHTLLQIGFAISVEGDKENPIYTIRYDGQSKSSVCYSKLIVDEIVPKENFGTIFISSDAEKQFTNENFTELSLLLSYPDIKFSDGTAQQIETYLNSSNEIAREMLFLFSISQSLGRI